MNMIIKSINEARILAHILKITDYQSLLINSNIDYPLRIQAKFQTLVDKFNSGYPMDYILGKTYFLENEYCINEGVLIPRPETEYWVQNLKYKILQNPNFYRDKFLLDVGCGSGTIGLSLSKYFKKVILIDLYKTPLKTAQTNIIKLNINNAKILKSNLLYEVSNFYQTSILPSKKNIEQIRDTQLNINFAKFNNDNIIPSKQIDFQEYIKTIKQKSNYKKKPFENNLRSLVNELIHSGYVLVSNPPYVTNMDRVNIKNNKIEFEPKTSIFSNHNGLSHFRRLMSQINDFILPCQIHIELDIRHIDLF